MERLERRRKPRTLMLKHCLPRGARVAPLFAWAVRPQPEPAHLRARRLEQLATNQRKAGKYGAPTHLLAVARKHAMHGDGARGGRKGEVHEPDRFVGRAAVRSGDARER